MKIKLKKKSEKKSDWSFVWTALFLIKHELLISVSYLTRCAEYNRQIKFYDIK